MYLNFMFSFFRRHSKIVTLLSFVFIWILFWGNTNNPDLSNYMIYYEEVKMNVITFSNDLREPGYFFINLIFAKLGFSYHYFMAVVTLICYLLIFSTIRKYTNNYNCILLLYCIHLFIFDIIQIRNFISVSLFIFAIRFLIKDNIKNRVKYTLIICIASTIHTTSLFFLLALLIKDNKQNHLIKFIAIFSILGCIIVFFNGNKIPFISAIMENMLRGTVRGRYLTVEVPIRYILTLFTLQVLNFTMLYLCKRNMDIAYDYISDNKNLDIIKFVNVIFWINALSFMFLPFCMQSINFYRLMRNNNILNFTCVAITNGYFNKRDKRKLIFNTFCILAVIAWYMYDLSLNFWIIKNIFENNIIFN